MDEKVLFNTPPSQDTGQNQPPEPTGDEQQIDRAGAVTSETTTEEQVSDGEEVVEEEPNPGFLGGILGGGLVKKLLIGIGVVILLTFIIILILPKGHPDKAVTLTWWGLWEDNSTMQSLILDYKKLHPNVTINYVKNDPNQYLDRLQTRLQNGTGPDVFTFHNTWLPMLSSELSPLSTNVVTPDQFKQDYYPVMQQDLTQNGAIYGIPMEADSLALFVNPDLFEAAGVQVPTSWDNFVKAAKQLTVKDQNGKIK